MTMKRKRRLLTALVAVLLLICVAAEAALSYPFETVTTDKVNLRRKASSGSVVLERLAKEAPITVLGASGSYYKVRYRNRTGYILKKYVNTDLTAPTVETVTGYPYETTAKNAVNIREARDRTSKILGKIPGGATVTVTGVKGSYAGVIYHDVTGFVKHEYLNLKNVVKPTPSPTPVPTLSPLEDASGYVVLQRGSNGPEVKALQQALTELGFYGGKADGDFGGGTENAVVRFQEKNSYPPTGVVDANLQAFLYSGKPLNSEGVKTDVKTLPPIPGVTVYLNDRGDLVVTVQERLKELGYYTGSISGVYNKDTQAAVKAFQKKNGLPGTGACDPATQDLLLDGGGLPASATEAPAQPAKTEAPAAATATPAPTMKIPSTTVKRGSKGEDAKLVQQRLQDLGYYTGKVDGKFGSASVKALKKFQKKSGLKADGVAGQGTYAVLFSAGAPSALGTPAPAAETPAPEAELPTAPPAGGTIAYPPVTQENCVTLRLGAQGEAVYYLQARLTELGYYSAAMDSLYKEDDAAAVRAFQKKNGLKADGVAGYGTQSRLYSPGAVTASGEVAGGTLESYTTLRKGMSGAAVTNLQNRLIELGYYKGKADGQYGSATAKAVKNFQKANGLKADGVAGPVTQAKLYGAEAATPTPKPSPTPKPTPAPSSKPDTLQQGDRGSEVKSMQQRLIALGYYGGKADGYFGAKTKTAVKAFQRKNGLKADGVAGPQTLTKLNSASAIAADGATPTPAPTKVPAPPSASGVRASMVIYANWYTTVKAQAKQYPYATVIDYASGISWQVHMFSLGAHADCEPLTANDTHKMERAFGGENTWNPKAVWVVFGDGKVYMASCHDVPHDVQHIMDNDFDGHFCIHFPRTAAQVASIGVYATRHQSTIDAGWAATQAMR